MVYGMCHTVLMASTLHPQNPRIEVCDGSIVDAFLLSESGTIRIANLGTWVTDPGEGWVHSTDDGVEVDTVAEWDAGIVALAADLIATDQHR